MVSYPVGPLVNVVVFVEVVTRMMDEGHTVAVIYLDFAKAFSSVNRRFLLAKVKSIGIPFWSGLESARRWRALGGHSNSQ